MKYKVKQKGRAKKLPSADGLSFPAASELPADVKQLQEELRKAKLHNELLNAMIDIAESELNIEIRKKSDIQR